MITVAGVEYVTTVEACDRLDIAADTLRKWYAPQHGQPRVRLLRDPDGRPVRHGRHLLVAWPDTVEAEYATRTHPRRPRSGPRAAGLPEDIVRPYDRGV